MKLIFSTEHYTLFDFERCGQQIKRNFFIKLIGLWMSGCMDEVGTLVKDFLLVSSLIPCLCMCWPVTREQWNVFGGGGGGWEQKFGEFKLIVEILEYNLFSPHKFVFDVRFVTNWTYLRNLKFYIWLLVLICKKNFIR